MKNIVFISGSPKINEKSVSEFLIQMAKRHMETEDAHKTFIDVRQSISKRKTLDDFEALSQADAVIIAFPLYVFCLPGILMRFLEDYYQFFTEKGKVNSPAKVYAIVNCGFPEPEINREAVRVIRSFCRHINADFRFGVLIGGGGMILGAKDAPFMKKTLGKLDNAFSAIAKDLQNKDKAGTDEIYIRMNFPKRLYFFMGNRGWFSAARKNGLKKKDLYRKPYLLHE
ncbi:NAD(P)H-dependent oxidoreductase [Candidatus Formimonas warabiya]|uniref:Flavodoxin n=1 Tax=Formimonas warabiya TaxID=1761012 RepID=A0A3G1KZV2_FORW1|nr:NAD(P)H-dependent oxidoreductase [Candidatus Formimonas warabiya]ATW27937.1 flavodoxin [Candidatus Formimonas warabiya]